MMSTQLSSEELIQGNTYFLVGYLDEKCGVPFMQTLIYLRSSQGEQGSGHASSVEHVFADAIAWFRVRGDATALDSTDEVWIGASDLDGIKDIKGLISELQQVP